MANGSLQTRWLPPTGGVTNSLSLRFLNENRAGDGGFLQRSGTKIVRSNSGKEFKIRGTHVIWQSAMPSASDAPDVAKTMADLGYNWVRFNGDEKLRSTSSSGFFWDSTAADYITFDTTVGTDNFLTRMDFFREELAKQGIYTCFSMNDLTPYPAAQRPVAYQSDTWPGSNNYGKGIYWLDVIKTKYKLYLKNYLTRPSAVTGVPPILDPSFGMVYLLNEDSAVSAWSANYWTPAKLSGQARTDMIALWSAYAQSQGQSAQTEMLADSGAAWGSASTYDLAGTPLQTVWMQWLASVDSAYTQEMYAYIRSLGFQALIMFSTANYISKIDYQTDILTSHCYTSDYTAGTVTDTTNLTRTAGNNVGTVASAGTIAIGHSISGATGWPTDTYVTNVSGTTITFDQAALSNGTTSTAFTRPVTDTAGHMIANHTAGILAYNFSSVRDYTKPYFCDEVGLTGALGSGRLAACYLPHIAVLSGLQNTNGYAHFCYLAPQNYPATINTNNYSYPSLHSESRLPSAMLGIMITNLLFEKGYVSPLTQDAYLNLNYSTIISTMVTKKSGSVSDLDFGTNLQSLLIQRLRGMRYTGVNGDDNSSGYSASLPSAINFPGTSTVTTITGNSGDKTTWNRSSGSGTYIIHESNYDLLYYGILPTSFTSINGITIEFPVTLSQTCTTTSGSAVVTVTDGTAWSIGDHVIIAGVNFTSSNKHHIARVADISGNNLTLVTQGGNTGIVAATCDASVGPGAVITRPQWGVFGLCSMDGTTLGNGKAMMVCFGDWYPVGFKLLSNTEVASANLSKFPNLKNVGSDARPYVDVPVGKVTFPTSVRASAMDSNGKLSTIGKSTAISISQNPAYLIEK